MSSNTTTPSSNATNPTRPDRSAALNRRHAILFWLIVCLPLAGLVGLGWRLAHAERSTAHQRLAEVLAVRLDDIAAEVKEVLARRQRELEGLIGTVSTAPDALRTLIRRTPGVRQVFVIGADGRLQHPDPRGALNDAERAFLYEFGELFDEGTLGPPRGEGQVQAAETARWIARFSGPGLHLLYCRDLPDGTCCGVLLERSSWIADVIAHLPTTHSHLPPTAPTLMRLVGADGHTLYEWGTLPGDAAVTPVIERPLAAPLASWRLQHFVDPSQLDTLGRDAYRVWGTMVVAAALALIGAGVWFYREYNRHLRAARQQVSFVNQVSHELKTPLTNIRMYAELLEQDLDALDDGDAGRPGQHLKVIVDESQRLSRLIGNVLAFATAPRDPQPLRPRPAAIDDVIAAAIDHFKPVLARRGITPEVTRGAPAEVMVDTDVVEQIVGNLLSNVEKYGGANGPVAITSSQSDGMTTLVVHDSGPGIPAGLRERIFQPFYRMSNDLAAAPGTGIGLTIARELARRHGGDLTVRPAERGACFELRLRTPPAGGRP